jgi:hypothetical protein
MSNITQKGSFSPLALTASGTFQQSTDSALATLVGTRWDLSDGGEVILVSTPSGTTTVAGLLYQDAALVANHQGLTVTAFNAYGTSGGVANSTSTPATVTVTLGATALTLNQYQGGFLVVQSGTGIGQTLRIQENPAAVLSATGVVITLEDAPNLALDTTSVVSLVPPHGANIIINPTTPSNVPVGIALYAISPSSYGFLKCKGLVGAKSDSSVASVGNSIMPSTTTAGDVTLFIATGANLGSAAITMVSAKVYPVILNI